MKNSEGFELKVAHVPSSFGGDFASVNIEKSGCMSIGVYPLTIAELRQLAGELLECADRMDAAAADNLRVRDAFTAAMLSGEREAA